MCVYIYVCIYVYVYVYVYVASSAAATQVPVFFSFRTPLTAWSQLVESGVVPLGLKKKCIYINSVKKAAKCTAGGFVTRRKGGAEL